MPCVLFYEDKDSNSTIIMATSVLILLLFVRRVEKELNIYTNCLTRKTGVLLRLSTQTGRSTKRSRNLRDIKG